MTKEQERDSGQQIIELINMTLTDVPVDLHRAWNAVAASFGLGRYERCPARNSSLLDHKRLPRGGRSSPLSSYPARATGTCSVRSTRILPVAIACTRLSVSAV